MSEIEIPEQYAEDCANCVPKILNIKHFIHFIAFYTILEHLQWLSMVKYDWDWYVSILFYLFWGIVISSAYIGQQYAKKSKFCLKISKI